MNEITKINKDIAGEILEKKGGEYLPLGRFYYKDNNSYIGMDNSDGECFVEEFADKEVCFAWLRGEIEYYTENDYGKSVSDLMNEKQSNTQMFEVIITETLVKSIEVVATNEKTAYEKVLNMYENERVVLDYSDFNDVTFKVNKVK